MGAEPDAAGTVSGTVREIPSSAHEARAYKRRRKRNSVPADLARFIRSDACPCAGAKSALALGRLEAIEAGRIGEASHDARIRKALMGFARKAHAEPAALWSFACLFEPELLDEAKFEAALWARVQALHDIDAREGVAWARDVSNDAASPAFSLSIGGTAYFLVGLHPDASRGARRFSRPAIIFNPHEQFERLRADGRYAAIQQVNREREMRVHGSINPMLADFGSGSEAAQYSGRQVGEDWVCPFHARGRT